MTLHPAVPEPLRVLVAGAGVAGLETMLALHELAGPRVAVTLMSPATEFVYKPLSVAEPFAAGSATRHRLDRIAADFGADILSATLDRVAPGQHSVFTDDGREVAYDVLVVATGARREPAFEQVVTFTGGEDSEAVRGIVQDVEEGYGHSVAFVVPPGATWPLPLYELALMTARRAREMGVAPSLTLITPEESALAVFGPEASEDVEAMLASAGVALVSGAYAEVVDGREVVVRPSGERIAADRIVALPVLRGTAPRGLPSDRDGFIPTDRHGRVTGVADVYAAGDGTQFPVKQGGIATQQADAVAEAIAKRAGARLEPRAFRPVLRGMLMTGGRERYLRGEVSRGRGGISEASSHTLWWPPGKIAGRYLAPYLAGQRVYAERVPQFTTGLRR